MYGTTNIFTKDKTANPNEEIQTICGVECYEKDGTMLQILDGRIVFYERTNSI